MPTCRSKFRGQTFSLPSAPLARAIVDMTYMSKCRQCLCRLLPRNPGGSMIDIGCMSSFGDFPEYKQFWTQCRQLSSFFHFDPFRRPFFVVLSLQSSTVGLRTNVNARIAGHLARLVVQAWSCVTGKCSKRNPLQSVILPVLTGWAIKCLYRQLDFKIVKCTHIVCNIRSYTAIVTCYGHILR